MSGHTPGPWRHSSVEGGWDGVRDKHGTVICALSYNNPDNATLIAAAPELLEALKGLLGSWVYADGEGLVAIDQTGAGVEHEQQVLAARAAIAKAAAGAP